MTLEIDVVPGRLHIVACAAHTGLATRQGRCLFASTQPPDVHHAAVVLLKVRARVSGVPPRRRLRSRSPRHGSADGTPTGRSGSSSPFYSAAGSLGPAGSLLLGSAASSETNRRAGLYRYPQFSWSRCVRKLAVKPKLVPVFY